VNLLFFERGLFTFKINWAVVVLSLSLLVGLLGFGFGFTAPTGRLLLSSCALHQLAVFFFWPSRQLISFGGPAVVDTATSPLFLPFSFLWKVWLS
jgi:hypothetical protein